MGNFLPQENKTTIKISVGKPSSLNKKRDSKESKEGSKKGIEGRRKEKGEDIINNNVKNKK